MGNTYYSMGLPEPYRDRSRRKNGKRRGKVQEVYTNEDTGCQEAKIWMDGEEGEEPITALLSSSVSMEEGVREYESAQVGEWVDIEKRPLRGKTGSGGLLSSSTAAPPEGQWEVTKASDTGSPIVATSWIPYTINDPLADDPAPLAFPNPGSLIWAYANCAGAPTSTITFTVKIAGSTVLSPTITSGNRRGNRDTAEAEFTAAEFVTVILADPDDATGPFVVVIGYRTTGEVGGEEA